MNWSKLNKPSSLWANRASCEVTCNLGALGIISQPLKISLVPQMTQRPRFGNCGIDQIHFKQRILMLIVSLLGGLSVGWITSLFFWFRKATQLFPTSLNKHPLRCFRPSWHHVLVRCQVLSTRLPFLHSNLDLFLLSDILRNLQQPHASPWLPQGSFAFCVGIRVVCCCEIVNSHDFVWPVVAVCIFSKPSQAKVLTEWRRLLRNASRPPPIC